MIPQQPARRNKNLFKMYLDEDYQEIENYVDQNYSNSLGVGKIGTVSVVCPAGWGHSMATSIRRAIIGGAYGSAVVAYRIEGFESPFATSFGVSVNALKIAEALRAIRCHIISDKDFVVSSINIKGGLGESQDITAGMFSTEDLLIENADMKICSISDVDFNMEILVDYSYGYLTEAQNRERLGLSGGWFGLTSIFSPIRHVKATSQTVSGLISVFPSNNKSTGESISEYDKISLEVSTVNYSSSIKSIIEQAMKEVGIVSGGDDMSETILEEPEAYETALNININNLSISAKTANALQSSGIETIGDILFYSPSELKSGINGIGAKSISEIQDLFLIHLNGKEVQTKIVSGESDDTIRAHLYKMLGVSISRSNIENIDRIIYNLRSYLIHGEGVESKGKKKKGESNE